MPPEIVDASAFSPDVQDFLRVLYAHKVKSMIVGGEAVIFYGHIRVTGDIDVFYDREPDNAVSFFRPPKIFGRGRFQISGIPPSWKNVASSSSSEFLPTGSTSSTISTASTSNLLGGDEHVSSWRARRETSRSATSALKTSSRTSGLPGGQRTRKIFPF